LRRIERTLTKENLGRFQVVVDAFLDLRPSPKISEKGLAASLKEREAKIQNSRMWIDGPVLQKVERGLLVESGKNKYKALREVSRDFDKYGGKHDFKPDKKPRPGEPWRYYSICLLKDFPNFAASVDGDLVRVIAYPAGSYTYKNVQGGLRTVRVFTCDRTKVFAPATDDEISRILD